MTDRVDLRALLEAATDLPWKTDADYVVGQVPEGRPGGEVIARFSPSVSRLRDTVPNRANASLAVAAVNSLPHLLDAVKAARHYVDAEVADTVAVRAITEAEDYTASLNEQQMARHKADEAFEALCAALSALDEQEPPGSRHAKGEAANVDRAGRGYGHVDEQEPR